ncbi:MAG: hypothetical protein AAF587_14145 [Bacteroidota bacterium]
MLTPTNTPIATDLVKNISPTDIASLNWTPGQGSLFAITDTGPVEFTSNFALSSSNKTLAHQYLLIAQSQKSYQNGFCRPVTHAEKNLQVLVHFKYTFTLDPGQYENLAQFMTDFGRQSNWNFDLAIQSFILQCMFEVFKAKKEEGRDTFEEFFDILAEARTKAKALLLGTYQLDVQLDLPVEHEDKIGLVSVSGETLGDFPLAGNSSRVFAQLPVSPKGKYAAIATFQEDEEIAAAFMATLKQAVIGPNSLVKSTSYELFYQHLSDQLSSFLDSIGRELEDFRIELPDAFSNLPVQPNFTDKLSANISGEIIDLKLRMWASMTNPVKFISLHAQHSTVEKIMVQYLSEIISTKWKNQSLTDILINFPSEQEGISDLLKQKLQTIGYALEGMEVSFEADFPKLKQMIRLHIQQSFALEEEHIQIPIEVHLEGVVEALTYWKDQFHKDFQLNTTLQQDITALIEHRSKSTPIHVGIKQAGTSYEELDKQLLADISQYLSKVGLSLSSLRIQFGKNPLEAKLQELCSEIYTIPYYFADEQSEHLFKLQYRIQGILPEASYTFSTLNQKGKNELLRKITTQLSEELRAPIAQLLADDTSSHEPDKWHDILDTHARSCLSIIQEVYGVRIDILKLVPSETENEKKARDQRMKEKKKQLETQAKLAEEYDRLIKGEFDKLQKAYQKYLGNPGAFKQELVEIAEQKIQHMIKHHTILTYGQELELQVENEA